MNKKFCALKTSFKLTLPDKQGHLKCLHDYVKLTLSEYSPEDFWLKEDKRNQDFSPEGLSQLPWKLIEKLLQIWVELDPAHNFCVFSFHN